MFQRKVVGNKIHLGFAYNEKLKDLVKNQFSNARWNPENRVWVVDNDQRAEWNFALLDRKNPYKLFDQELVEFQPKRKLYSHQIDLVRHILTRKCGIWAAEMGTGKSLAAIEAIEATKANAWWVGPKAAIESVKLEMLKWKSETPLLLSYEELTKLVTNWAEGTVYKGRVLKLPNFVVFDEAHRLKNPSAKRTKAAKHLADAIRADGYVLLMSGSPSPKSPVDWWSLCEIARPGFLKEGSQLKFRDRVALVKSETNDSGFKYPKIITYKDSAEKCGICGRTKDSSYHDHLGYLVVPKSENLWPGDHPHRFEPMIDEISNLSNRLKGLVTVKIKKECLDLPDKVYQTIKLAPDKTTLRLAKLVAKSAPTTAQAIILLRELSDGFQYTEETVESALGPSSEETLIKTVRKVVEQASPKDQALIEILESLEDSGRLITYAGFTASIDKICKITKTSGWEYIRVDGRGWTSSLGLTDPSDLLKLFASNDHKINFIGHPASAGVGLTLTASDTIVYYSNDFNAESRIQSEDRIHRPGMKGANIIDLVHLPVDQLIIDNLKNKRRLQDITMGQIEKYFD